MLEQAFDTGLPLLERVKYCAFFSSHMDEFFTVRVAGLLDQVASGLHVRSTDGRTPRATLAEIRQRVEALTARQAKLWADELVPALAAEGIRIGEIADCTEEELEELAVRFRARDLPGADAARGRSRSAVPVHLGALAEPRRLRPRPGERARSAWPGSRSRKACRASSRSASPRPVRPARERDHPLPGLALPADGDRRAAPSSG